MISDLPNLEELPRQNASHVKNKWREVVRQVHQSGSLAITNHAAVEMVLLDAATYRRLTEDMLALKDREAAILEQLGQRFDARLEALQQPAARQQVASILKAKGKLSRRPKAGASY